MNFRKKTNNITKVLYIILIMCVLSIVSLSLYSLFNEDEPNKNGLNEGLVLNNNQQDGEDSEDVLGNMFKKQTTEPLTNPPTTERPPMTTQRQTIPPPTIPPVTTAVSNPGSPAVNDENVSGNEQEAGVQKPLDSSEQPAFVNPDSEDEESVEVISSMPEVYIKPLNGYVSKQHNPDIPEFSVAMNDYRTHAGIDIDGDIGVNVKTVADGIVAEVTDDPLMGRTVVIDHANGIRSIYMNLQEAVPQNITAGAEVKSGDVIGGVGYTSLIEMTDVPHLHFEMMKNGSYVNPYDYITFG
jgi:murein DD-endopeptidase MepM/ murein hydrolase activator NlpD